MENLNAEKVISKLMKNDSCYAEDIEAIRNAISLIRSQEQRIKELTEENERLTLKVAAYQVKDKLLSNQLDDKCDMCIARERADTVRQMQEELKKTFSALCKGEMGDLYRIIDQIAEEMLEGEK